MLKKETKQVKRNNNNKQNGTKKQERPRKQRRPESNPFYLHMQATPCILHHSDTHVLQKLILSYQNNLSLPLTLFEACGAVFIMNSNIRLRKINLSAYFKAISHYLGFNGPTRCRR